MSAKKSSLSFFLLVVIGAAAFLYYRGLNDGAISGSADNFTQGRLMVTEGRYEEALPLLEKYLTEEPRGKFASRAHFFIAKAHMGLGRFDMARQAFETTVREFPDTLEGHKSKYKLALLDYLEGRIDEARRKFKSLADHPDGPLAPEAQAMAEFLGRPAESPGN